MYQHILLIGKLVYETSRLRQTGERCSHSRSSRLISGIQPVAAIGARSTGNDQPGPSQVKPAPRGSNRKRTRNYRSIGAFASRLPAIASIPSQTSNTPTTSNFKSLNRSAVYELPRADIFSGRIMTNNSGDCW